MRWAPVLTLCLAGAACSDPPDSTEATDPTAATDPIEIAPEASDGRWRPAPGAAPTLDPEQLAVLEELQTLGYADGVRAAPDVVSVTRYDEARCEAGLNFYTSGHAPGAFLVDMNGELVHSWSYEEEHWPELRGAEKALGRTTWRRAYLYPNGDVLAIYEGLGMLKLDRHSKLLWRYPGRAHHDVDVLDDGTIWTLSREAEIIPRVNPVVPCMDDFIVELASDGRELRRISVLECLENGKQRTLLKRMQREKELFHTNSIEILDGRIAGRVPEFAAGNVLISILKLNAVVVVDVERESVVWSMTAGFKKQHHPRMLDNGNMLLFDNMGKLRESTVYEVDPKRRAPVWAYEGSEQDPFFSRTCGSAYRLPRGNTLITESDGGRAFEVTPEGEIVWEFYSPHRGGEDGELIATLFDLQRFPPDAFDWLER
jgi:hypothetical protein